MKKFLFSFAFFATFALFSACGDDVTEVTEVHQDGMAVLDAGLELSKQKCDTTNVGDMLFVTDSSEVFVCDGKNWLTLKGADGKDGVDGKPGEPGTDGEIGPQGPQGETGEPGEPGTDGDDGSDGESCTAKPVTNDAGLEGIEVTCGKTVVGTIWSGEKGEPGTDGDDGSDGESCTAKPVTNAAGLEGIEVTCGKTVVGTIWSGKDGVDGDDGDDGKNCEVSREGNVLTITCVNSVVTIDLDELIQASSSSVEIGSSSAEGSSSSEAVAEVMPSGTYDCKTYKCDSTGYLNQDMLDTNGYGEILDTRDDQVYKVVTIGEGANAQVWMAQNLNYDYNEGTAKSYCYDEDQDKCSKYGRLYTWAAAVEACPSGWHLPSQYEYDVLINYIDNSYAKEQSGYRASTSAGLYLKSKKDWFRSDNCCDTYGFSALPAGRRDGSGGFSYAFVDAYFWSASEYDCDYAYIMNLFYLYESAYVNYSSKYNAFSVRCLKD